ncbi:MAG: hypothetical protein RLQ12_20550 [Cyclobacteriaceae bacterium]
MTIEELKKKVEQLRLVTEAKMKFLRDHTKLIDQAFEELKEIQGSEMDLIYEKNEDLDKRMVINGLSK